MNHSTTSIKPIFALNQAHFDRKSSVFGTKVKNLNENVANHAILTYKKPQSEPLKFNGNWP